MSRRILAGNHSNRQRLSQTTFRSGHLPKAEQVDLPSPSHILAAAHWTGRRRPLFWKDGGQRRRRADNPQETPGSVAQAPLGWNAPELSRGLCSQQRGFLGPRFHGLPCCFVTLCSLFKLLIRDGCEKVLNYRIFKRRGDRCSQFHPEILLLTFWWEFCVLVFLLSCLPFCSLFSKPFLLTFQDAMTVSSVHLCSRHQCSGSLIQQFFLDPYTRC